MNALAHCIECAYSPHRTPEAEAIALAGVGRIVEALPVVVERPTDVEPRTRMLDGRGARWALPPERVDGSASRPGPIARRAHRHAARAGERRPSAARPPLQPAVGATGDRADRTARSATRTMRAGAVDALLRRLGLPVRLSDCGVDDEDLDVVVRLAESPDARAILEAAF